MVNYLNFYIDVKTLRIHQSTCTHLLTENNIYLGIYRNSEVALIHARSKGYKDALICKYCDIQFSL